MPCGNGFAVHAAGLGTAIRGTFDSDGGWSFTPQAEAMW